MGRVVDPNKRPPTVITHIGNHRDTDMKTQHFRYVIREPKEEGKPQEELVINLY